MTLTGAFVGVMAAVGVLLIAAGWRGAELRETRRPTIDWIWRSIFTPGISAGLPPRSP